MSNLESDRGEFPTEPLERLRQRMRHARAMLRTVMIAVKAVEDGSVSFDGNDYDTATQRWSPVTAAPTDARSSRGSTGCCATTTPPWWTSSNAPGIFEMDIHQRLDLVERQQAEMQGVVAFLLAVECANCAGRYRPEVLIELKERVVSSLLGSPLRSEAVEGAEAALAAVLGSIRLVENATRNGTGEGAGGT